MPVPGQVPNPLLPLTSPRAAPDSGSVGYYVSSLASGVRVELAATEHAGIYRYTFDQTNNNVSSVVIDVSHVLPSFRGLGLSQNYTGGSIQVFEDGHYEASGTYNNGWNLGT
jgi:putative alpha-1,2-mannosidase